MCDSKSKLFSLLEILGVVLKIAALVFLLALFRYFYVAIVVWVLSYVPSFFKRNLLYKYRYVVDGEKLIIEKVINEGKIIPMEDVDLKEIVQYDDKESETKYYQKTPEKILTIEKKDGKRFSIAVDDYFYALVDYGYRRQI